MKEIKRAEVTVKVVAEGFSAMELAGYVQSWVFQASQGGGYSGIHLPTVGGFSPIPEIRVSDVRELPPRIEEK